MPTETPRPAVLTKTPRTLFEQRALEAEKQQAEELYMDALMRKRSAELTEDERAYMLKNVVAHLRELQA